MVAFLLRLSIVILLDFFYHVYEYLFMYVDVNVSEEAIEL